jgi:hypothetical protein
MNIVFLRYVLYGKEAQSVYERLKTETDLVLKKVMLIIPFGSVPMIK